MEREMEAPGFWDDPDRSNQKMKELKNMKDTGFAAGTGTCQKKIPENASTIEIRKTPKRVF